MKKINNKILTNIINESIQNLLFEGLKNDMSFGIKGNIPVQPASNLCKDINPQVLEKVDNGDKSIPKKEIGMPQYFGNSKAYDAYKKYSIAISRRADLGRTPVNFFVFLKKIRHGWKGAPLQVYESNENYLIGTVRGGVFLCIYICPKNIGVGMFKFIKEVCEYDNVVFAVTDDMADMLERLGCPKHNGYVQAKFRGKMHDKMVYGSTKKAAEQGAKLLNLMGQNNKLGKNIDNIIKTNPQMEKIYQENPDIIVNLMNDPIIMQCLMNNPQIIDFMLSKPDITQDLNNDITNGFIKILQQYKQLKK